MTEWLATVGRTSEQLTLVFDGGNTSQANLQRLDSEAVHYVGGVPTAWLPDLLEVELSQYHKLEIADTKHIKVHRVKRELWNAQRTVLVVFSPTLYRAQRKTMNRQQAKADGRIRDLAVQIDTWRESRQGKGFSEHSVRRKIRQWTAREHLRDYLDIQLELDQNRVLRLSWAWDLERKRTVQRRHLGKKMIVTDHHGWDDATIAHTYRRLTRTESLFKISKSDPGIWWPMYHWTDSKIRVHALYCFFALLLLAILRLELRAAGIPMRIGRAVQRLAKIQESVVVYTNGAANRVLTDMDDTQKKLARALALDHLAEQLGTTVLPNP